MKEQGKSAQERLRYAARRRLDSEQGSEDSAGDVGQEEKRAAGTAGTLNAQGGVLMATVLAAAGSREITRVTGLG